MHTALNILLFLILLLPVQEKDKTALEKHFMDGLAAYTPGKPSRIPNNLTRIDKNLYVSDNGFYETEAARYSPYFRKEVFSYRPVCESALPVESVMTLLAGFTDKTRFSVHLTQRCYNHATVEVDVPLAHFLGFCLEEGFLPYVGIESSNPDLLVASLFLVNQQQGFCHTFKFTIDPALLDQKEGFFTADGYTYTPIDNLKQ
jgi:hypothetical protein